MRVRGATAVAASILLAAGCTSETGGVDPPGETQEPGETPADESAQAAVTTPPDDDVTVIAGADAVERAVGTSAAVFDEAPVVLLAADGDIAAQADAAPVAVGLGMPLLLSPAEHDTTGDDTATGDETEDATGDDAGADGGSAALVGDELRRLAPAMVVTFGDDAAVWAEEQDVAEQVVPAPSDTEELATLTGVAFGSADEVTGDDFTRAVAELQLDEPQRLTVTSGDAETAASGDDASATQNRQSEASAIPSVARADLLEGLAVLVDPAPDNAAAAATARASGALVLVSADADPRADGDLIAALAGEPPSHTLAVGEEFGSAEQLRQRVAVASTGTELPGGGQVLLPHRRFIALYGTPRSSAMGSLGEQPMEETFERAADIAADYEPLVDVPVVPTLEIITTIAHTEPGPEGDYSLRTPVEELRPWVDTAAEAGFYVVLDLQPGRTDFLSQAREYEELLLEPHVGLALDPEWRLAEGQRHLQQIGSVDAAEVNEVAEYLAGLTAEHQLPQKLLVLHQFRQSMITNRDDIETEWDELAVLIHADGFGTPDLKFETWDVLHQGAPDDVWWGWKNFIDEDQPMFTPEQTMDIEPDVWFVSYQ